MTWSVGVVVAYVALNCLMWLVGRVLHEVTHAAAAWLCGATNIHFDGRLLYSWYVYFEAKDVLTARFVGIAPRLIGFPLLIYYIGVAWPLAATDLPVLSFFFGYAVLGGLSDFSLEAARERAETREVK